MYQRASFYFALAFAVAVIGFYPSYFSRLQATDATHHFHGITASAWMTLLIVQAWLMRSGRVALHRSIGKLSLLLVPLFLASGLMLVHGMLANTGEFHRAFGPRLAFLDFTSLAYFVAAFVLALHHRRRVQLHARWMSTTAVLLLPPAVARLLANYVPGAGSFVVAVHLSYLITEMVALALILDDRRQGKMHAPYVSLMLILLIQHAGFWLLPNVSAWTDFSLWFGSI